jgi:hypothetical protein
MKIIASNEQQYNNVSFAYKISREKFLVYDLRVTLNGEDRFFVIKIIPAKNALFLQAINENTGFRLEDFGEILHRGWGEPTDKLKQTLQEQYGMYSNDFLTE